MMKKGVTTIAIIVGFFASLSIASEPRQSTEQPPTIELLTGSELTAVGGRVLTLFSHPQLPNKMWAGTEYAGLWQSIDSGSSWNQASVLMSNIAVTSIVADPLNSDIIYVGTGDGRVSNTLLIGKGLFKSVDGGKNWNILEATAPASAGERWGYIHSIAVSTEGVVLAATSDNKHNGYIYRSSDGGYSWSVEPVFTGSSVGPHNIIHKVRFDPDNPHIALFMDDYANVIHSIDGGVTWKTVKKSSTCQ